MNIFRNLFYRNSKPAEPNNTRLLQLLDIYWRANGKGETYENVVLELMNGNSFLMLPGQDKDSQVSGGWITTKEAKTIGLSSVYTLEGIKVLAAFTDQKALLDWSKGTCSYFSMRSQDVLQLCETNGIERVVINNNSSNTFVLEKTREDAKEYVIQANSDVKIGTPNTPLDRSLLEKMIIRCNDLHSIKRVYHYGQMRGNEFSLILGFELTKSSENEKKAVVDMVRDVIANETLPCPLDIFFIETEEWREQIAMIAGSLIYKA